MPQRKTSAVEPPPVERIILYVGKGGVGKTTMAAATSVRAAELGHRTLVVSTDLAHSLGDVFDLELESSPRELAPNLFAQEINVLAEIRESWGSVQEQFSDFLQREGMSQIQADEMAVLPGMEEVAALVQIERQGRLGNYDCLIIDAAPTGETIRLLSLPESFQWYADRMRQWRNRLRRVAGPLLSTLLPTMNVIDVLSDLASRIKRLREALVDPARSSYRIVLTPERTVLREAQRAETYLHLFDYPVDSVYVNRILSHKDTLGSHLDALVERQTQVMNEIRAAFGVLPQHAVPLVPEEPVGVERLSQLARLVFRDRDPTDIMHHGRAQSIEPTDSGYLLRLPMPNVEVQRLELGKRGDELYIDLGSFRRELALPLVLSDFEPGVARLRDGILEIPFDRPPMAASTERTSA